MRKNFSINRSYDVIPILLGFCNWQKLKSKSFFAIIIISILWSDPIICQTTTTSITSASLEYDGIFGIGWGVFAIIIAIVVGIICCIYGISTVYPAIFITIGFCIPVVIFIFIAFSPLDQPGNLNLKDNTATNSNVVVKWLFFSLMLIGLLLLLLAFLGLWGSMLIPQRVDSRAHREYFQKYAKIIEEEKRLNEKAEKINGQGLNDLDNANNFVNKSNNPGLFERDTRLQINNPRETIRINNSNNVNSEHSVNVAFSNNNLNIPGNNNIMNDKKKNFLGGLMRRRRNEEN